MVIALIGESCTGKYDLIFDTTQVNVSTICTDIFNLVNK